MASMLQTAFTSVTSWLNNDQIDEDSDHRLYCDCEKLIELIVEKAQERNNCVDIEQKDEDVEASPRHGKCPNPMIMKSAKVTPPVPMTDNALAERGLRDRAESGELGLRVGEGILKLQLITDAADGADLMIKRVNDSSPATLRSLEEIPSFCSCILAICFDATKEEIERLESAVQGSVFSWRIGCIQDLDGTREDATKDALTDQDFDAFIAITRALLVLHVINDSGLDQ